MHCGSGYDIGIVCTGQKKELEFISNNSQIIFEKVNGDKEIYKEIVQGLGDLMSDEQGCFYNLLAYEEDHGGTIMVAEDRTTQNYFDFSWMEEEERACIQGVYIKDEYLEGFETILRRLMSASPYRRLFVKIRCQCMDRQNVIGSLSIDDYMRLIKERRLLSNVVYVLSDDEDRDPNELLNERIHKRAEREKDLES